MLNFNMTNNEDLTLDDKTRINMDSRGKVVTHLCFNNKTACNNDFTIQRNF